MGEEENSGVGTTEPAEPADNGKAEDCDSICGDNCGTCRQPTYEEHGNQLRAEIGELADTVLMFKQRAKDEPLLIGDNIDREEMIANVVLAFRHMEDARLRIGKSLQARQGGVSILDKMTANESAEIGARPLADESKIAK